MVQAPLIEKVKCYFCHKRGYMDPNKPRNENDWYLEWFEGKEYQICGKCYFQGKIRCPGCGHETKKLWTGAGPDDYEIHCDHCDSVF